MDEGQFTTLILGAGGGLTAAIVFLYKEIIKLNSKQTELAERLGELKGKHEGIKELSASVLQTVEDAMTMGPHEREDSGDSRTN